ncbi:MAG: DinB family protein [Terriglobales bacterium]|jgi:uncharacterized damage-inducible protein DinB
MHAKYFVRMFTYDSWANRECIAAMQTAAALPPDALGRMAHILSAEKLWLERILQQSPAMPVWPALSLEDCLKLEEEVSSAYGNYLARLANQFAPGSLDDKVEYRNTKGEIWTSRVEDILTHVLLHSTYHRGQIALQLRAAGSQPAYTDFIHGVRRGFIE